MLDIIKDIKLNIKIVSSNIDSTLKKKYESQYSNVTFINNNTFHDRFIIIDRKELYNSIVIQENQTAENIWENTKHLMENK